MTRLENTIIYLLQRAQKKGKNNLSKFELFKFLYLLETESYKFAGKSFFDSSISFVRNTNGPISVDVYNALNSLDKYLDIKKVKKSDYPYPRHCISLKKRPAKTNLTSSEKIFINSVMESYIDLPIKKLKQVVYNTEPMKEILKEEKKRKVELKGEKINFDCIPLDEDVVDIITA